MARIRKAVAYRRLERPYTRISKYRAKSFVRSRPNINIVKYDMGKENANYDYKLDLIAKSSLQIRHNAIEASRQTALRLLEKNLGKEGFHFRIRMFPHHILRENPLASGAGADRLSTGMKMSFGKTIGTAAQVKEGKSLFTLRINKKDLELGKKALTRIKYKLPCSCKLEISQEN